MKKWLLSELFYPIETSTGYFMTKIAEKLGETEPSGINVICGPDRYDSNKLYTSSRLSEKVVVHRITIPSLDKNQIIQRSLRMLVLAIKMAYKLFRLAKKGDKVFIVTNPAPLLVLVSFVKQLIKFHLVIIVHDVFPENMLPGNMIKQSSLSYKFLRRVFNWAYKQADKIICVGEDMKELMSTKTQFRNEKISVVRNWADCDQIFPLNFSESKIIDYYNFPELRNKVIIQFAGNIGRLQGLPEFLEAFQKADNPGLALVFIGEGAMKQFLIDKIASNDVKNVYFIQSKSRDEQNVFLNASHIGLVTLNEGMYGLGVPSKSYNIWAAGKPILFVGDESSEIARNIREHEIGWAFNWQQKKNLVAFLKNLSYNSLENIKQKSINSRVAALENFDRDVILKQYDVY